MSTLHDVAIAMAKEDEKKVADFGEDVTSPSDLGWHLKEPEGISPHVEQTREKLLVVREGVAEKLRRSAGSNLPITKSPDMATLAEDVVATLGNRTLDLVEGLTDRSIATSQGVALAGAMATQRVINEVKGVQNPQAIPVVNIPLENISPKQNIKKSSTEKLISTLQHEQPQLTKATFTQFQDKPDIAVDITNFGRFSADTQLNSQSGDAEKVTETEVVITNTQSDQENIPITEVLTQKEGLLRAQKELLTETILKNTQSIESLRKAEKDISDILKNAELKDSDKENTLQFIREQIKTLETQKASAEAQLASATKEHDDVLSQLASKQESIQTQQPETKGNTATIEVSSLLFSREGLTDFQKKIADQESVAALFALLASPEYKNHQFGSGTRKESGVQLAQRISEYILQAETGDKVSPRFFIPDAIIAGKVQELLEKSSSWKKGKDSFGMDIFEKVESDSTIQDVQVGKAVAGTIEKVKEETSPGWFERVGAWFGRTDTVLDKTIEKTLEHRKKVGFFAAFLLALGLWAGNGQDNKKTEGAPANADNTSESAEQGPTTSKGNHSLYNPGTQESQPATNAEKEALRAAQDAVTKVYAEQGKVAFDEGGTKVFTGEEVVADGPATEINPESAKPRNLMDRIGNPLDKGIGDIKITNGTVYVEPRGQVAYIEAPTPKTYWAQAVINDALNYNVQSRNGTMDAGKANQWAKGHLRNVFEMYERRNNEMRMTGESYTDQEILFLRSAFLELQKKIAGVAQSTNTLSPELEKVTLAIRGIDESLSGQY